MFIFILLDDDHDQDHTVVEIEDAEPFRPFSRFLKIIIFN